MSERSALSSSLSVFVQARARVGRLVHCIHRVSENKRYIFGRPFVKRFARCYCYRTVVCPVLSVCNVGVLWPNGLMDQDETWRVGRPRPWRHCVRWGPSFPVPQRGTAPPIFGPCLSWPNRWMDQDGTWHEGGPQSRPHYAR